jgi:predicted secreted protein
MADKGAPAAARCGRMQATMTMRRIALHSCLLALGLVLALPPPPGRAAAAAGQGTMLAFTEHAEESLVRDRVVAELAVEATDPDPARLQGAINRRMTAALARAKTVAGLTATTGDYSVYEERPKTGPELWHGRQVLRLEAGAQAALLPLVGTLQHDGLVLAALQATLSRTATRAAEDRLTIEALHHVKARAATMAAALGLRVVRIRSLRVGNAGPPPQPLRAMAMAMTAEAAPPPVLAPDRATVEVTVEAEIELGAAP